MLYKSSLNIITCFTLPTLCEASHNVGKTTTATTLSYLLSKEGYKVALIDFDGQRHSTIISGVAEPEKLAVSIYEILKSIVMEESLPPKESYVIVTENGVDLIPANNRLDNFEKLMSDATFAEYKLKEFVDTIKDQYDYILIDCMPKMGTPMINMMICCDGLIIPVQSEPLAVEGMGEFLRAYHKIKGSINTDLEIVGILITMDSERTRVSKKVKEQLQQVLGERVRIFNSCIPRSTRVSAVTDMGMNICESEPDNAAAKAYQELVKELMRDGGKNTEDTKPKFTA